MVRAAHPAQTACVAKGILLGQRKLHPRDLVEQPCGSELLFPLLKESHERALARQFKLLNDDLVIRLARKGGDAAGDDDLESFLRLELQFRECAPPDHRVDAGAVVLQAQAGVARAVRPR